MLGNGARPGQLATATQDPSPTDPSEDPCITIETSLPADDAALERIFDLCKGGLPFNQYYLGVLRTRNARNDEIVQVRALSRERHLCYNSLTRCFFKLAIMRPSTD